MPNHPLTGARLGQNSDNPLGGMFLAQVVNELSPYTIPHFDNAAARDAAYAAWVAAGNAMRNGLQSFTENDQRYWRYGSSPAGWKYAGGAPPPIIASAVNTGAGWSALNGHIPGTYTDSSGLIHLVGGVVNNGQYTPGEQDGFSDFPITLNAAYRPAGNQVVPVMVDSVPNIIVATVLTDGRLRLDNNGQKLIEAKKVHYFDGITIHPGYTGAV